MRTTIIVQNLKCGGCVKTITSKVSSLKNISDVTVEVETSTVSFLYEHIDDALEVKNKLKVLGYPSIDDKNSVTAKAKSFVSCATGKMSAS